jgi:hypothetical protein
VHRLVAAQLTTVLQNSSNRINPCNATSAAARARCAQPLGSKQDRARARLRQLERDISRRSHRIKKVNGHVQPSTDTQCSKKPKARVVTVWSTRASIPPSFALRQPGMLVSAAHAIAYGPRQRAAKLRQKPTQYAVRGSEREGSKNKRAIAERRVHARLRMTAVAPEPLSRTRLVSQSVLLQHR